MESSPAFDYNVINADILLNDMKEKFSDKIKECSISYDPPGTIGIIVLFEDGENWYRAIIYWKAEWKHDRFEITDNCWTLILEYFVKIAGRSSVHSNTEPILYLTNKDVLKLIGECFV